MPRESHSRRKYLNSLRSSYEASEPKLYPQPWFALLTLARRLSDRRHHDGWVRELSHALPSLR